MRFSIVFCFRLLIPVALLYSCIGETQESIGDNSSADSLGVKDSSSLSVYSSVFQSLVKSDLGVIRSVDWNTTRDAVRKIEDSTTLVESGADYLDYLITLDTKEQVDVIYYFNNAKNVNKVELNIYPANDEAREALYKEFTSYFNAHYGKPSAVMQEVITWRVPAHNLYIEARKLGNTKVKDLQIDFKPLEESQGQL